MIKVPPSKTMSSMTLKLHCEKRHPEIRIITFSAHEVAHRAGSNDHEHKD
jgi:hypothetical protein